MGDKPFIFKRPDIAELNPSVLEGIEAKIVTEKWEHIQQVARLLGPKAMMKRLEVMRENQRINASRKLGLMDFMYLNDLREYVFDGKPPESMLGEPDQ